MSQVCQRSPGTGECEIMKRHVVEGTRIRRRTPEIAAPSPIVAFERHLTEDFVNLT
jgi:hypothetical protein